VLIRSREYSLTYVNASTWSPIRRIAVRVPGIAAHQTS
jgi:hypothetical protein